MNETIKELLHGRDISTILLAGVESLAEKLYQEAYDKGFDAGYNSAKKDFTEAS